jgi:hypothetical protein
MAVRTRLSSAQQMMATTTGLMPYSSPPAAGVRP